MKKFFLLFFFFSSSCLLSQNFKDEFYKRINTSNELALKYCDSIIKTSVNEEKAIAYSAKAFILSRKVNYQEAEKLFNNAYAWLDSVKNIESKQKAKVYILNFHALYLLAIHNLTEANIKIRYGLQLAEKFHIAEMQIKFKGLLGRSFSLAGLGKQAIKIGKETIEKLTSLETMLKKEFFNENLLYAHLNTSSRALNVFLEDSIANKIYIDTSQYYIDKAKLIPGLKNFKPNLEQEYLMLNIGAEILFFKKQYQQASVILKDVINIANINNLKKKEYQAKFRLAECYFFLNEFEKAENIFNTIDNENLKQYRLLKNDVLLQSYYAQIYSKRGKTKKALKYVNAFNNKLEDFYKTKSIEKIHAFTQNELMHMKKAIDGLKSELKESKTKNNVFLNFIIGVIIITIGIISFRTIIFKKQKRDLNYKIQKLLEQLHDKKNKRRILSLDVNEEKAKHILSKLKELEKKELFKNQNYSLNEVAKQIGSNSTYVSKVINKYWKKTFIEYTNELRVDAVILKLKEDRIYRKFTLIAIAESVGYKSLHSFNKHFKKNTGITPKKYIEYFQINELK